MGAEASFSQYFIYIVILYIFSHWSLHVVALLLTTSYQYCPFSLLCVGLGKVITSSL
jgi:hypothetical protein